MLIRRLPLLYMLLMTVACEQSVRHPSEREQMTWAADFSLEIIVHGIDSQSPLEDGDNMLDPIARSARYVLQPNRELLTMLGPDAQTLRPSKRLKLRRLLSRFEVAELYRLVTASIPQDRIVKGLGKEIGEIHYEINYFANGRTYRAKVRYGDYELIDEVVNWVLNRVWDDN